MKDSHRRVGCRCVKDLAYIWASVSFSVCVGVSLEVKRRTAGVPGRMLALALKAARILSNEGIRRKERITIRLGTILYGSLGGKTEWTKLTFRECLEDIISAMKVPGQIPYPQEWCQRCDFQ